MDYMDYMDRDADADVISHPHRTVEIPSAAELDRMLLEIEQRQAQRNQNQN